MSEKYKIQDQDQPYYITFAVESWVDVFTRKMYRDIFLDSLRYCQLNKGLIIYTWCLMSNHVHMVIGRNSTNAIDAIVRDFKKYSSVHICLAIENNDLEGRRNWMLSIFRSAAAKSRKHIKYQFWETGYHPVELQTESFSFQTIEYVHENPVKEGIVEKPEDYLYSSARDYCGKKGLLDIMFL